MLEQTAKVLHLGREVAFACDAAVQMRRASPLLLLLLFCDVALSLKLAATRALTRRNALLSLAPASAALLLPACAHADEPITYGALSDELIKCRETGVCSVERVRFTVESGEQGEAIYSDGARRPIIGIPADDPNSDSSPYKLVAKLRDAKVPYTYPFTEALLAANKNKKK